MSVNGKRSGVNGYTPYGSDSSLSRQAVRSAHAQVRVLVVLFADMAVCHTSLRHIEVCSSVAAYLL